MLSPCADSSSGDLNSTEDGLISLFRVSISCRGERERDRERVRVREYLIPNAIRHFEMKKDKPVIVQRYNCMERAGGGPVAL